LDRPPSEAALLQALYARLSQRPAGFSSVVMSFDHPLHAIPDSHLPPDHITTCMRVLRFAEGPHAHVVKNVLIDQANIERTVRRRRGGGWRGSRP
jgi:hypothetical protein